MTLPLPLSLLPSTSLSDFLFFFFYLNTHFYHSFIYYSTTSKLSIVSSIITFCFTTSFSHSCISISSIKMNKQKENKRRGRWRGRGRERGRDEPFAWKMMPVDHLKMEREEDSWRGVAMKQFCLCLGSYSSSLHLYNNTRPCCLPPYHKHKQMERKEEEEEEKRREERRSKT